MEIHKGLDNCDGFLWCGMFLWVGGGSGLIPLLRIDLIERRVRTVVYLSCIIFSQTERHES